MNDKKLIIDAAKIFGIQTQLKNLWLIHPILEQMAFKLAGYIGLYAINEEGKPLLADALNIALTRYNDAMESGKDEDEAMPFFIKSLLESGTKVFNQQITVETAHGAVMWQPFASGVVEFVDAHKDGKVTVEFKQSAIKKTIATAFVSMWLVPPELLNSELWANILNSIED